MGCEEKDQWLSDKLDEISAQNGRIEATQADHGVLLGRLDERTKGHHTRLSLIEGQAKAAGKRGASSGGIVAAAAIAVAEIFKALTGMRS